MANYYLNDDGTTSKYSSKKGKNYIQQTDGTTIENKNYNKTKKAVSIKKNTELQIAQKEQKDKNQKYQSSLSRYQNKLANKFKENNIDFKTEIESKNDKKLTYEDKSKSNSINNKNIEKLEKNKNKVNQIRKELKPEADKVQESINEANYADYKLNKAKVKNEKTTLFDKTIGVVPRALIDLTSPLTMTSREYVDDKGKKTYLPSYNELKQEKVSKDYKTNIGKILGDVGYNVTKIGATSLMTPFVGSSVYFTDMFADNYEDVIEEGYDRKKALLNSTASTGLEFLTGKVLGSATKRLTGGTTNEFSKAASNVFNKMIKNPKVANILGNASSEAIEEFSQEYLDNFNRLITLEQETDIKKYLDVVKDKDIFFNALYSAGVGGLSGGILEGMNNSEGKQVSQNTQIFNLLKENLEEKKKITTDKKDIAKYDNAISEINNYLSKPFTTSTSDVYKNINNTMPSINRNSVDYNNEINLNPLTTNTSINMPSSLKKDISNINSIRSQNNIEGNPLTENNNPVSLPLDNNTIQKMNAVNQNQERFVYETSDNIKIDNFRRSASEYMNNSNETKSLVQIVEKVINDKGYNVAFDNSLGDNVNGCIGINENGEVDIRINPNSERAGEFILIHEITHAIDTNEIRDLVIEYAKKNPEYNNALESLKEIYKTTEVSDEVLADIVGQLFGYQEFINKLSINKPSLFKRIYDEVISFANKITGNSKESLFMKDLKNKWEKAYRKSDLNKVKENIKKSKFSIKENNNGKYVNIDTDQNIFDGIEEKDYNKIAKMYINDYLKGNTQLSNDDIAIIDSTSSKKYTNPGKSQNYFTEKMKLTPELKNVLHIAEKINSSLPSKDNSKYRNWEYYKFDFSLNGKKFEAIVNIGIDSNNNKHFYEVNKIKKRTDGISETSLNSPTSSITNNISQNEKNVNKNDTSSTKYSMQKDVNNTPELKASSFSLDKNAKRYEDLSKTYKLEYLKKDNGDIKVSMLDSNNNLINEINLFSVNESTKQLGTDLGTAIFENAEYDNKYINIGNDINNMSGDMDYFMSHRPSKDYGNASNFEKNMPDIFEHPEWYISLSEQYNRESLNALKKIRNNPEGNIKIYRATSSNKINPGDWVTPSKIYAQEHLERSLNGNGSIVEMTVKAKDVLFAGDDINEFGYFPENEKYSKNDGTWQQFVENNFKSKGTKTYFEDTRLDTNNTKQNLINKKEEKITNKYEREKIKNKKFLTKEVAKILEFSDYKSKQKFTELISEYYDNPNYERIKQDIIDNFSEKRIEYLNEELAEIKRIIRTSDLKVDDYVKKNISDYNFFRKSNFSKLKLKNEGQSIDSFYTEMSDMYPNIFSRDITNEVDQLYRLSDFMNEDISMIEKYNLDEKVINKATDYVYNSLKNKENIDELISSISISPKEIRKEKIIELREFASDFLENSSDWKDKKAGISYKINTMKRNFYDIMGKKDAKRIYENFILPIFTHNDQMQKDIYSYNKKISELKLDENESIAVQMFGELKYNPETLVTQMQVDKFIEENELYYDKISKSVEVFREVYEDLFRRRNELLKSFGYKEVDYRKGYFPHFVENKPTSIVGKALEKIGWKFNDDIIPTSIAGITEYFKPGKVWTSSSQQRKGKFTDYNALKGYDNYIRGVMNEIYFTEDIQKLRALENEIRYQHSDSGIQNRIDEIQSEKSLSFEEKQDKIDKIYSTYITPMNNFVTELRDYTNGIAKKKSGLDRTMESLANRKIYNIIENVSSRLSANMVGANLGSAITNFIPITQATSQVKSKYLIKGLKEAIKSQYFSDNFESKSIFLTTRLNEAERLYKTKIEKASEKANLIFNCIDSITANTIVRGKYYENLSKGMTEFVAMRNADEFARDLMAGRGVGEMPTIFNSKNPIVKVFTAFQLETSNQFGYMFKDLPRDLEDEGKKKLISAFIKMFIGAWIYNQITEKIVGRKAAFSPVDTIKEICDTVVNEDLEITEKSSDVLQTLTEDIPFVGGLVGGGRLPISSVANPINVIKGKSTVEEEAKKLLYYTVLPFGGGQLKKTIEGASMYVNDKNIKGSYNKKGDLKFEAKRDPLSVAQNLLFGQYSSKEAREYFNNHYMPISKETTDRLKKNNISINKYREYEDKYNSIKNSKGEKLKEIKSTKNDDGKSIVGSASSKKAYLIMNSKFSKKEKNYMLSKISNFRSETTVEDLNKLGNSKKSYDLYYSMDKDSREKFINELDKYDISVNKLTEYYTVRKKINSEYIPSKVKEKMIDYISASNLSDNAKWYLYSKDYGSDNLESQRILFNIKTTDYFNVLKYKNYIQNKYSGEKDSNRTKTLMFEYINSLNLNKNQKIILFKQAGYSTASNKKTIYDYINNLNKSKAEKESLFKLIY